MGLKKSLLVSALLSISKAWRPPCAHQFDYMRDMTSRDATGMVSCRCCKCNQVFMAEYGLALPGELIQLNKESA